MSRVEQPEYRVVSSQDAFEIRSYGAMIAAEAEVTGDRQVAIGAGFRLIAGYIFGGNAPRAKIEMTAPVQQQANSAGATIAMTAPVTQQQGDKSWKVRFIMPKSWTIESLPVPSDPRVKLVPVPAKTFAAIRFSGFASDATIRDRTADLKRFITDRKLIGASEPMMAFYDPPWTLPFFRRNEIMFELVGQ